MEAKAKSTCENCERLQARLDAMQQQIESLQTVIASLQEQLASARKDSSTSSKPPSSDIVKPPKTPTPDGSKRSIGGQPGHQKHDRALFGPELLTASAQHTLDCCPDCHGPLRLNGGLATLVQQVDFQPLPPSVEQHTCPEYWCHNCQKPCRADLPTHVQVGGLVGPNLTTLIAYLKGVCHASFSTIRKFLRDVVGVSISRGQISNIITKVSDALAAPYDELLGRLAAEPTLNVDETGHKDNGTLMWTWCFRAELYTLFKIDPHRSADVLLDVLGEEFDGLIGCDCYSAYRRFLRESDARVQFCLAHLIREVKYLTTLPDELTRRYGERLREALRGLFGVYHDEQKYGAAGFKAALEAARQRVIDCATQEVPCRAAPERLAKRMREYGREYFWFITERVGPTNNVAEQAIRFVVIDRHITQGTRGEKGQRASERLWTVIATCAQQGSSVWDYLKAVVRAHFSGEEAPSLLPE